MEQNYKDTHQSITKKCKYRIIITYLQSYFIFFIKPIFYLKNEVLFPYFESQTINNNH